MKFKKDNRDKLWAKIELNIQGRGRKKDKKFILSGKWKKFLRNQNGLKVFAVDGEWLRNNVSIIFGHGGHGYVHEFIPLNEIWIATHHFDDCGCENLKSKNQKTSKQYFDSTTVHEITEFKEMKRGMIYWKAHHVALKKEEELGLLENPHKEIDK